DRKALAAAISADRDQRATGRRADVGPEAAKHAVHQLRLRRQQPVRRVICDEGGANRLAPRGQFALPARRGGAAGGRQSGGERRSHGDLIQAAAASGGGGAPAESVNTS